MEIPDNIILYGKWDVIDDNGLYYGISKIPLTINGNRVLIDLASHEGENACNKTITIAKATEVIFIGNPDATLTGLTINVNTTEEVKIVLRDFNMVGNIIGNSNNVKKIIYLSCDHATLSRDLKILKEKKL